MVPLGDGPKLLTVVRFSSALSRPNVLKYSDYMTDCCKRLQSDQEFPSDNIIPYMISLYHIGDQIYAAFKSEDTDNLDLDQVRLRMHVQLLQSQLKDWKRGIPQDTSQQSKQPLALQAQRIEFQQQLWIYRTSSTRWSFIALGFGYRLRL